MRLGERKGRERERERGREREREGGRERERQTDRHGLAVPLMYAFIGCFLYVS